jgi:hypothetical protein
LFRLIASIFCFVASFYLLFKFRIKNDLISFFLSIYFLFGGFALLFLSLYSIIPDNSPDFLNLIFILSTSIAYLTVIILLSITYTINTSLSLVNKIFELLLSILLYLILLLFYPSNVVHTTNFQPEISLFYIFLLSTCFLVPFLISFTNIFIFSEGMKRNEKKIVRKLNIFLILGFLIIFINIISFFEIIINETVLNLSFMNIFNILVIIQGFFIIYYLPNLEKDNIILIQF